MVESELVDVFGGVAVGCPSSLVVKFQSPSLTNQDG